RPSGVTSLPHLRQRARTAGVLDVHGETDGRDELLPQIDIPPSECRRVEHTAGARVDHPGNDDPYPLDLASIDGDIEERPNPGGERGDQALQISGGRHAHDVRARMSHCVADHDIRSRGADVDRDARSLTRVDVEERRLAATGRLTGRAFDDVALGE